MLTVAGSLVGVLCTGKMNAIKDDFDRRLQREKDGLHRQLKGAACLDKPQIGATRSERLGPGNDSGRGALKGCHLVI